MGLDPATWAILGSTVLGAGANIYGANQQGSTNNANLNAQLAHQNMLQQYANSLFQPGMNPFAQAMLNFTRQGLPGAVSSFNPAGGATPSGGGSGGVGGGGTGVGGGTGGGTDTGGGGSQIIQDHPNPTDPTLPQNQGASAPAQVATFNGQPFSDPVDEWWAQHGSGPRFVMIGGSIGDLAAMTLLGQGAIGSKTVDPAFANAGVTPEILAAANKSQAMLEQGYQAQSKSGNPNVWPTEYLPPELQAGYTPGTPASNGGGTPNLWQTQVGETQQPNYGYLPGGNMNLSSPGFDIGAIPGQLGSYGGLGNPSSGNGSYGSNGQMFVYNSPGAFTYNPMQLGQAPTVTGTQAFNNGQDPLLQMYRKNLTPQTDPSLQPNLAQINSGDTAFNNSDLFRALQPVQQQQLDQQIGQLHASAGSLGERFGSSMMRNEALLRSNVQNQVNLQNAQIAQQSFENAQNRRVQGLGLSLGNNQNLNQFTLGAAGLQQQAAAGLGNNALNANLADQNLLAQYGIQNANIYNSAAQFNAGQQTAENQFNASQGNTYNSMILQALASAANTQQAQSNYNSGIFGALAGVGIPQAVPSPLPGAIGDAASSLSMLPLLMSMMNSGNNSSYSPYSFQRAPSTYY